MARKYINLFDENGNPVKVPLGADAENVDLEYINGLEAENVQEAIEELAGQQTTIEMDDAPTANSQKAVKSGGVAAALATKQDKLSSANAGSGISISEQGVISTTGGGGSDVSDLAGDCVELSVELMIGYRINVEGGALVSVPQNTNHRVSEPIASTGRVGKFLFFPGENGTWGAVYRKYRLVNGSEVVTDSPSGERYGSNLSVIIPIMDEDEYIQIKTQTNNSAIKVYIVTKHWLQVRNLCTDWAGKRWAMYGDSYVAGQNVPDTWHKVFSTRHYAGYTNLGHGGWGLVSSGNYSSSSLLSQLTTDLLNNGEPLDVDVIGVCCGRNDYSNGVPIGDIDDMITEVGVNPQFPASYTGDVTFMGGLNYICKWLLDNYPTKRIFFVTPWWFLDDNPTGNAIAEPLEYVEAVKTIASRWGIPCFDAAHESGICPQTQTCRDLYFIKGDQAEHSSDTSHLNYVGHRHMASGPVAGWLENLFRD